MQAKLLSTFLVLSFAASLVQAQDGPTVTGTTTWKITKDAPGASTVDGNTIGVSAGGGPSSTKTITVEWGVDLVMTADADTMIIVPGATVNYSVYNSAKAKVDLAGMTPPTGNGQGTANVGNATVDTGVVQRQTSAVSTTIGIGAPAVQHKSVAIDFMWVRDGDSDTYRGSGTLETDDQKTTAYTNPLTTASSGGKGGQGGTTTPPMALHGDSASGTTTQIVTVDSAHD